MKRSGDSLSELSMPACIAGLGEVPCKHTGSKIIRATKVQDTEEATDYNIITDEQHIAIRVRGFDCLCYDITTASGEKLTLTKEVVDLTVRAKNRCNDTKTERQKIIEGYATRYWMNLSDTFPNARAAELHPRSNATIRHSFMVDLHKVRAQHILEEEREILLNRDHRGVLDGTGFIAITFDELLERGCVLWASPTISHLLLQPAAVQEFLL